MNLNQFWYNELKSAIETARIRIKLYEDDPFHDKEVLKVAKEMHNYGNGLLRNSAISPTTDINLEYKLLAITDGLKDIVRWAAILRESWEEIKKTILQEADFYGISSNTTNKKYSFGGL